ncbi:MAG TPA: hypothetical protein VLF20_03155 [Patescibacteria group bacterium]|nr:hypothetical protein [Patescibacteria group bacterium]
MARQERQMNIAGSQQAIAVSEGATQSKGSLSRLRERLRRRGDEGGIAYGFAVGISLAIAGGLLAYANSGDWRAAPVGGVIGGVIGFFGGLAMNDNEPIL